MANRSKNRRSGRRKSRVRIPITGKGDLTSLGYRMNYSASARHKALSKAVRLYGYQSTMGKINALYVFNKNNHPSLSRIASADKKWLKENFGSNAKFGFSPRRASRRRSPSRRGSRKRRSPRRGSRKRRSPSRRRGSRRASRRRSG